MARGLSYSNTAKIMSMCPNIRSFKFVHEAEEDDLDLLHGRLEQLVSRFTGLRHFELSASNPNVSTEDRYVIRIIKHLPMLEHLKVSYLTQSQSDEATDSLAWNLSQLKFLSHLRLTQCQAVDETWCLVPRPKIITNLALVNCPSLLSNLVHRLIPCMAPKVIELEIAARKSYLDTDDGTQVDQFQLILPALRSLKIGIWSTGIGIPDFLKCSNLQQIVCNSLHDLHPSVDLICESTWPKLQYLALGLPEIAHDGYTFIYTSATSSILKKYCNQAGIKSFVDTIYM